VRHTKTAISFTRSVGSLLLVAPLFFSTLLYAQTARQNPGADISQTRKAVESPIKYTGMLYKSGNHRDPFLNPLLFKKEIAADEELARGVPPPGIAGTYIAQAKLQGIVLRDEECVAVVRGADNRAYFIRQGDKFFDGYLKSIDVDFITLVRETKMRSGKTLTQDIVKRLRTP
jgi:hypothetical protein